MILKTPHPRQISQNYPAKRLRKACNVPYISPWRPPIITLQYQQPWKEMFSAKRQVGPSHEKMLLQNPLSHPPPSSPIPLRRIRRIKPDVVYLPICSLPYCKIFSPNLAPLNACFRALKVFEFEMTAIYSCEEHFDGGEGGTSAPLSTRRSGGRRTERPLNGGQRFVQIECKVLQKFCEMNQEIVFMWFWFFVLVISCQRSL